MSKNVRRDVVTAHDPLSRFDSGTVTEAVTNTVIESGKKSAVLIEIDPVDYLRLKAAAKARGLTLRGYIRSAAFERLRDDERR